MDETQENLFEIVIDFEKGGDPNRVFKSMAELIDTFQSLDQTLCEVLGIRVENSLLLEDIKNGSLRTIIRNLIEDLPDEHLANADVRKIIGHYLVKSKYAVLRWCQETPKLTSPDQVDILEGELVTIAEESNINSLPAYQPPNRIKLLNDIHSIQKSTRHLCENDTAYFNCNEGESNVHNGIEISEALVNEVLIKETVEYRNKALVKVKKPDYLGKSKWLVKFQDHNIDISITHEEWLKKFQNKEISVQPGDSLRGSLTQYISYGHDMEVISTKYEMETIDEIIEAPRFTQAGFEKF